MKKLITISIFISLFAIQSIGICDVGVFSQGGDLALEDKATTDSIYYHHWYQEMLWNKFPYYQQHSWTFVRFSPTTQQITDGWTFSKFLVLFRFSPGLTPTPQCTIGVWNTDVSPANIKGMWAFWDTSSSAVCLIDSGRYFDLTGDFWIGYCEAGCPGGDTIIPCTDGSAGVAGRNYYSISGMYGTQTEYTDHNILITAYIKLSSAVEEKAGIKNQNAKLKILQNPAVKNTTISYSIPVKARVELNVCDLAGRPVRMLINEEKPAGSYNINLDANDLTKGVYFVKFQSVDYRETRKLVLIR